MRVWGPKHLSAIRPRACGGVVFIAELLCGLRLHLSISRQEEVDLCGVWRGEECILWDKRIGFCAVTGAIPPAPDEKPSAFDVAMRPVLRRNCFLLGAVFAATEDEVRQWRLWQRVKQPTHRFPSAEYAGSL